MGHPYREAATVAPTPAEEPPEDGRSDTVVLALVLLVVGGLGVGIGISADRTLELKLGLLMIALAAKVASDLDLHPQLDDPSRRQLEESGSRDRILAHHLEEDLAR